MIFTHSCSSEMRLVTVLLSFALWVAFSSVSGTAAAANRGKKLWIQNLWIHQVLFLQGHFRWSLTAQVSLDHLLLCLSAWHCGESGKIGPNLVHFLCPQQLGQWSIIDLGKLWCHCRWFEIFLADSGKILNDLGSSFSTFMVILEQSG